MAWSTRQIADIAGTTIKTVRHYHKIGLLDEPERAANGYKQYRTQHLVRLLRIRRMSDLGVPLSQIKAMGDIDGAPDQAIRDLNAELTATIERLQRVRAELTDILRYRAPIDVPTGFGPVTDDLTDADRSLIMICSRMFTEEVTDDMRDMMSMRDATDREFNALPADADQATIEELAERMAPLIGDIRAKHPSSRDPGVFARGGAEFTESTMVQAVVELYNPAQIQVLQHVNHVLADDEGHGSEGPGNRSG
ncbi:MerR family transcriptional regulator [Nocardiopsis sp. MG754419]|uniref:helix-turn-helix domain-containing protein n=1 Tax=Nocardiopsis sp. MG754419 TaxID=2259865 RepID=UPI001BAB0043|nr:MerR family transcriptional regulator [Nocardiopsis sp. MG754419]MBR8740828.1 MerR family transcriptional regulator [Nocardiopsis sp. MG754419]